MNIRRILVSAVAAAAMLVASAETYTWSRYDLSFDVPNGGFVTYNSASVFEIQWHDLTVSVRLFDKSGADDNFMKYNLQKLASGYNMYDTQLRKSDVKGFKGFNLNGTLPDGSRACLVNMVSKKSNLALQIEINYLQGAEDDVSKILKSFAEGKKQKVRKEKSPKQKIQKKGAKPKPIKPGTVDDLPEKLYDV
ncbi:MAG: hypothetical protein ACI4AN_07545 [Muribaculaceae bacterium]